MIGMMMLWSITLPNPGPTPQIIDLGPAPTHDSYLPKFIEFKNADVSQLDGFTVQLGTSSEDPSDIQQPMVTIAKSYVSGTKYFERDFWSTQNVVPAAHDLYIKYSCPTTYTGTPITIDIFGYKSN